MPKPYCWTISWYNCFDIVGLGKATGVVGNESDLLGKSGGGVVAGFQPDGPGKFTGVVGNESDLVGKSGRGVVAGFQPDGPG